MRHYHRGPRHAVRQAVFARQSVPGTPRHSEPNSAEASRAGTRRSRGAPLRTRSSWQRTRRARTGTCGVLKEPPLSSRPASWWYSDADSMPGDPVRVLRLITRLNVGGPAIQAITLSHRLTERGFRTLLAYGRLAEGEGDMRYLLPESVETSYIPSLCRPVAPAHDSLALIAVYRLLCRSRPAIVHTHTAKAGTLGRLAAAIYNRTIGTRAPVRVVHTYHGHVLEG